MRRNSVTGTGNSSLSFYKNNVLIYSQIVTGKSMPVKYLLFPEKLWINHTVIPPLHLEAVTGILNSNV